jgi:hypothetical protein
MGVVIHLLSLSEFCPTDTNLSYNCNSYDDVIALAQSARGDDPFGYRAEFINLVRLAKSARE